MMPEPATRPNLHICDGLRFCTGDPRRAPSERSEEISFGAQWVWGCDDVIVPAGSNFTNVAEEVTPGGNPLPFFGNNGKEAGAFPFSSPASGPLWLSVRGRVWPPFAPA